MEIKQQNTVIPERMEINQVSSAIATVYYLRDSRLCYRERKHKGNQCTSQESGKKKSIRCPKAEYQRRETTEKIECQGLEESRAMFRAWLWRTHPRPASREQCLSLHKAQN